MPAGTVSLWSKFHLPGCRSSCYPFESLSRLHVGRGWGVNRLPLANSVTVRFVLGRLSFFLALERVVVRVLSFFLALERVVVRVLSFFLALERVEVRVLRFFLALLRNVGALLRFFLALLRNVGALLFEKSFDKKTAARTAGLPFACGECAPDSTPDP